MVFRVRGPTVLMAGLMLADLYARKDGPVPRRKMVSAWRVLAESHVVSR
jgi:hypothetical protein